MTEEDRNELVAAIAEELEDSGFGIETAGAREVTAGLIVDRIGHSLYLQGWMPPATYDRVSDWATRALGIPEHHVNRSVLTSHLAELSDILHDR